MGFILDRSTQRTASLFAVILFGLLASSCGSSTGQACDVCTTDADCAQAGLYCRPFPDDGSMRCASGNGTTQCRKSIF